MPGIEVVAFGEAQLRAALGVSTTVEYLAAYLREIGATATVIESEYVDRHYLDEFSHYYSRSFTAPPTRCKRHHFFRDTSVQDLRALLNASIEIDRAVAQERLQDRYLGFVVERPLKGARIGRTVLQPYPPEANRNYTVRRPYRVNLITFRLEVHGLAYQEQDRGAAVCASTALWSALQRVAYVSGNRTPTPIAVTRAALSPFPASQGLNFHQMATALSNLGYTADAFEPADDRGLFRAKVAAYLESALPVVLLLRRRVRTNSGFRLQGHAVTVTGYRGPLSTGGVRLSTSAASEVKMPGATLRVVYVHDDNLGSHAHYELHDSDERDDDDHPQLVLRRGHCDSERADVTVPATRTAEFQVGSGVIGKWPPARGTDPIFVRSISVVAKGPAKCREPVELTIMTSRDAGTRWEVHWAESLKPNGDGVAAPPLFVDVAGGEILRLRTANKNAQQVQLEVAIEYARTVAGWAVDDWHVFAALVPKPDKVRLSIDELFRSVSLARRLVQEKILGGMDVSFSARFSTGVEYQRSVISDKLDSADLQVFLESRPLPRHIGVVSLLAADRLLCELVLDVTEVSRDPLRPPLLAIIAPGIPARSPAALDLRAAAVRLSAVMVQARMGCT